MFFEAVIVAIPAESCVFTPSMARLCTVSTERPAPKIKRVFVPYELHL